MVDDESSKSLEIIIHLKIQIEEAKVVEELLRKQIIEKSDSCHKLCWDRGRPRVQRFISAPTKP
jgi:hypothetical protein